VTKHLHTLKRKLPELLGGKRENMTLEFGEAVKVLDEHIEILKQNLLFLMAERKKSERSRMMMMTTQKIITIKRELDKAVQERMKLSQIYCRPPPLLVSSS
jgi:hypothetical protein